MVVGKNDGQSAFLEIRRQRVVPLSGRLRERWHGESRLNHPGVLCAEAEEACTHIASGTRSPAPALERRLAASGQRRRPGRRYGEDYEERTELTWGVRLGDRFREDGQLALNLRQKQFVTRNKRHTRVTIGIMDGVVVVSMRRIAARLVGRAFLCEMLRRCVRRLRCGPVVGAGARVRLSLVICRAFGAALIVQTMHRLEDHRRQVGGQRESREKPEQSILNARDHGHSKPLSATGS